jgi:hypothetical protein
MNITAAFKDFLVTEGFGVFGDDLFIGTIPQESPDKAMWILSGGGSPSSDKFTNNKEKQYIVSVFYRNTDQEDVYETLQRLEELVNSNGCTQLGDYDTFDMQCTLFPTDNDLDQEDRTVGLIEVTITIYV